MTTKKSILLLLGISVLVYFKWLLLGIYTNSDWWYASTSFLHNYFTFPYAWDTVSSFGSVGLLLWRFPINFLYGLLSFLNWNSGISDRILVFWPSIILGNVVLFFLTKKITKSPIAGIIAALFFNYNTYFFVSQTAFLLYAGGVWSVIALYFLIHTFEKKSFFFALLSGLSLFISGAYDFRMAYISVFLLGGYYLFYSFFISSKKIQKALLDNGFLLLSVYVFFGMLNVYWILPLLFSKRLVTNVILQRGLFGNEFLNILYAITLFHPFWTGHQVAVFDPQPIFTYFWLIPIFAFLGLFFFRKNKNVLFFGIVSLLGIFLTKQVGQPFSYIYTYLFQHFPGFNAFREASKFYFLVALGYSVLIGAFAVRISEKFVKSKKLFVTCLIAVLMIIPVFNAIPFINGDLGMSIPHAIPKDYRQLDKFIFNQNSFFRTFWVPAFSRWGPADNIHISLSGVDVLNNIWSSYWKINNFTNIENNGRLLITALQNKYSKNLLSVSSIKYVILPLEDKKNDDDFFIFYGEKRGYYEQELNKIPYLKRIDIGTKDIGVYENPNYRPHIYLTTQIETIYNDIPYKKVDFTYVNPTKYTINVSHVSSPFYINFSDSFNPNWELRLGTFAWFDALYKKNYFLPVNHFANDAGLNSFSIDPGKVCSGTATCIKNSDGSYDMHLTLYFQPQSYLYAGLIVSGTTFIAILIALGFLGIKEIKQYGRKH